ncbi:hypothetical protein CPC08DRAFT_808246 [Agrocybe pediades]|nr:hypothetical protein CPC08DRAFT_808246 [Agrocybe pediades]
MPYDLPIADLLRAFSSHPILCEYLDFEGCLTFIELVELLKPTIKLSSFTEDGELALHWADELTFDCPEELPLNIQQFLCKALNLEESAIKLIWQVFSPFIWPWSPSSAPRFARHYVSLFLQHGIPLGLAFYHFMPPNVRCLDPLCTKKYKAGGADSKLCRRGLSEHSSLQVTVFTQDFGPVPGISTSMFCRGCGTRYYPNYFVNSQISTRAYYRETPSNQFEYLHVAEHVFVDRRTCNLFSTMMLAAWTSASNCAKIYNEGIALEDLGHSLPAAYTKKFELDTETVWNGVLLHWLLDDAFEREEHLELAHNASSQAKALEPALRARNLRMAGTGQEAWNHICDLCCHFKEDEDGNESTCLFLLVTTQYRT